MSEGLFFRAASCSGDQGPAIRVSTLLGELLHATRGVPHPWMGALFHGWLRPLVDPVTRLVEENPRVGEKSMGGVGQKHGKRGQGTVERDEILINVVTYLKMKNPRVG